MRGYRDAGRRALRRTVVHGLEDRVGHIHQRLERIVRIAVRPELQPDAPGRR
jgi:hypothetical protein